MEFIIAPPNPGDIIGRRQLLTDIHQALDRSTAVALVHGIGGIGKTTAAAAYAHSPECAAAYDSVCWLEVVQSLPQALTSATALQRYLGVEELVTQTLLTPQPDPEQPRELYAFAHIVEALRRCPNRLLLMLDNANDEQELRQYVLALQGPYLRILVTSRADCDDLHPIRVDALPPEEAAALFRRYYGEDRQPGEPERPEVFDLLASFDYHTLLTEMLGKIGKAAGYRLPELLDHVRTLTLREENWQVAVGTGFSGRTHRMTKETLKTYLAHLFREIKTLKEEDTSLLRKLTVLPNRRHTTAQLAALFALEGDAVFALTKQLAALDQRGIPLREDTEWRLHPLFREVCLDQLGPFTAENCAPLLGTVGELVVIKSETKNWQEKINNCIYAEELLLRIKEHGHLDIAYLKNELSLTYNEFGFYEKTKSLRDDVLAVLLHNLDEKDPKIGTARSNLAIVLQNLGDLIGAKVQLELALASGLENFGETHATVAIRRSNLALVFRDLGDLPGAKAQLELALTSDLKNFGETHGRVATRRSNLALVFQDLGDLPGAKVQLELALASDLENFGKTHVKVAIRHSNLALVFRDLGDLSNAKANLELAINIFKENFGEKHPSVATTKNNLAYILEELGDRAAAIQLWQEALAIRRVMLPEGHLDTEDVLESLRKRDVLPNNEI